MDMKNIQVSKILTTTIFTASMLGLSGCNQWSQEEQRRTTIQNIKRHTIEWNFRNRCITILDAEKESLRVIVQAIHISPSDKKELTELTRRNTLAAVHSRMDPKNWIVEEYKCTIYGKMEPLNTPLINIVKYSKALTTSDRNNLLRRFPK